MEFILIIIGNSIKLFFLTGKSVCILFENLTKAVNFIDWYASLNKRCYYLDAKNANRIRKSFSNWISFDSVMVYLTQPV